MPTTANFGLPYPSLTDAPNVPTDIKNLADATDSALLQSDSGLQSNLGLSMSSGWSLNEKLHRVIGSIAFIRLYVARTGANLVGSTVGNVADTAICTLTDSGMWPQWLIVAPVRASQTGGTVQLSDTTGIVTLTDLHSSGVIATGDNLQMSFMYPLP